ncbi:MAG: carbohydrate ABC transporter permease [Culicoidibacterales bacterium]
MKKISVTLRYTVLILVGIMLIYPLLWMIGGTIKSNNEIFTSIGLFTANPIDSLWSVFYKAWITGSQYTMARYFYNTFFYLFFKILFTVVSVVPTAYAIVRFNFKFKKLVFGLVILTLLLPESLFFIPLFIFWSNLGVTDSYLPLIVPAFFATQSFFVFMLIQFIRGLPKELDEAAKLDGCNTFQTLIYIIVPLLKPAIMTIILLSFVWGMAEFQGPLIYISSVEKFPVSLAMKLAIDADAGVQYNQLFATSIIALVPSIVIFFAAQKSFIDGIATSGSKE